MSDFGDRKSASRWDELRLRYFGVGFADGYLVKQHILLKSDSN